MYIRRINYRRHVADGLYIEGRVYNYTVTYLIDSGANVTIVNTKIYQSMTNKPTLSSVHVRMVSANNESITCYGKAQMPIKVNDTEVIHEVWVADITEEAILGYDFLQKYKCVLDFAERKLLMTELPDTPYAEENGDEQYIAKIVVRKTTIIPPKSEAIISTQLKDKCTYNNDNEESLGIVESTWEFVEQQQMMIAKTLVQSDQDELSLRIINPHEEPKKLYANTVVATLEPIVNVVEEETVLKCNNITTEEEKMTNELPEHLHNLFTRSKEHLDETQQKGLRELLFRNQHLFAKNKSELGRTNLVKHSINTGDAAPIKMPARRLPLHQREIEKEQVEAMLQQNVIEPSDSPWRSSVVLVKKKDGSYRWCVDFRGVNSVTRKDSYPLPNISDTLDSLSGSKWFTTLDLQSGYWQIEMDEESKDKTSFLTNFGTYQFRVMPFGLTNAPATFERLMEQVLKGLQWETCLIYIDDVIVFAKDFSTALERLTTVFDRLRNAGLCLSAKKCHMFQKKVKYLGHVVDESGISTDPDKIESIKTWPTPKNTKQVRSFLGLCSYYRRYIRSFSEIASPLFKLTEKNRFFDWNNDAENSFRKLKDSLTQAPILAYPQVDTDYILDTDASNFGLGGVLSQVQDGLERVIGYYSRTLNKAERNYCITRKELLAVVASTKHFHHYLFGRNFLIRTDHGALKWLMKFKNPEAQVARWIEVLGTYEFTIEHRAGRIHGNADALSRRPCEGEQCKQCSKIERLADERPVHISHRRNKLKTRNIITSKTSSREKQCTSSEKQCTSSSSSEE